MKILFHIHLGMVTVALIGLLFVSQPRAIIAEFKATYYEREYKALCKQNYEQRKEIANLRGVPKYRYAVVKEN